MYQIAIEKKISKSMAKKSLNKIFGRNIQRWKLIILAEEPDTVESYPEDREAYNARNTKTAISLSDYMKKRWLIV